MVFNLARVLSEKLQGPDIGRPINTLLVKKASVFSYIGNYYFIWAVTMGNAATCKVCGSDIPLQTNGSNKDSNHHSDFYRAAGCGSDQDDSLVRGGERHVAHPLYSNICFSEDVFKKAWRVNLVSTQCVCMRFNPRTYMGVGGWLYCMRCDGECDCADLIS